MSYMCEGIEGEKVVCDDCDWSWNLSEGGDDPYVCHKCGNDNQETNYIGKKVMVYYNLHKHTFSVSYKNKKSNHITNARKIYNIKNEI